MDPSAHAETDDRELPQLIEGAVDLLSKFVIPLYEDYRGRPSLHGTCFFVRVGDDHFVVSAAHVLETIRRRPLFFYISPRVTRKLTGRLLLTPCEGERDKDLLDVGVLKLSGDGKPPYVVVDKFAMDISYLRTSFALASGKTS